MKKTWLVCLFAAVLALGGCGKKEEAETPEQENAMVSIATADFTQADAEALLKQEVSSHCGSIHACKVTSVKISGSNITGTYTYEENGKTMEAEVTLSDVTVNRNNPDIYSVADKKFSSPAAAQETAAAEEKKPAESSTEKTEEKKEQPADADKKSQSGNKLPEDMPALNLPKQKLDPEKEEDTAFATVKEEDGTYVYRIYLFQPGTLHISGSFDGGGTFRTIILNEDQSLAKDLINLTEAKELSYDAKLDAGFYYIYIHVSGGHWNAEFNTSY